VCVILIFVEAPSLSQVVGGRVRSIRQEAGVTADRVAEAARYFGLGWQRSTVASLETGRRDLAASEFLLLPVILGRCGLTVTLADLLDEPAALSRGVVARPEGFRELLTGEAPTVAGRGRGFDVPAVQDDIAAFPQVATDLLRRFKAMMPGRVSLAEVERAARDASLDAEQKAARKLGYHAEQVAHAAHRLWGQGLTAEREAQVSAMVTPDADARSVQAVRGRVTRVLVNELVPTLAAYPPKET